MIRKIRQNKSRTEVDIPCINLTPNRYDALAPAIVYVSNVVTIPVNSTTQMNTIATYRASPRARVIGTENVLKSSDQPSHITVSSCTRAKPWMFNIVYIKGNQMKLFQ